MLRTCWCRDCQYLAAGSATVNAVFRKDAVSIEGELADYESVADSGAKMVRSFCPHCGTPVSSRSDTRPQLIVLRVGLFEDREALAPSLTIWTESAPEWACINEEIPSTPRQPPPIA
ncbi:MAG TPA: GFA family protein [Rhizomicrobium sp.]